MHVCDCSYDDDDNTLIYSTTTHIGQYYSFQQVNQCIQTVPFNPTIRDSIIDSVNKTFQLHVFRDISKQSPDPNVHVNVDIQKQLNELAVNNTFTNDLQFQHALVALFRELKDGLCSQLFCCICV
jgi:hypothetical protein